MRASRVTFHRLHKFVENGAAFTSDQVLAAAYKVLVGSVSGGAQSYDVPPALFVGKAPTDAITVTFALLGFTPVSGVTYHVQVVATVDGVDSPASAEVTFTNSFTPSAPDAVSVS